MSSTELDLSNFLRVGGIIHRALSAAGLSLAPMQSALCVPQPRAWLLLVTLLMKDAKRLFRHLICSFSSLFTFCTAGSISSSSGTSRLSLMVTGAMQGEDPQGAPTRYPKPGRPHLEATRGLPKPTLHRLREPRQPRARRALPPPDWHGPLLTA